jgi:hypothetical protein
MAHQQQQQDAGPARTGSTRYRITPSGKAVAAWEQDRARTGHVLDLLRLLHTSGHGVAEAQLRQFMPLETLLRSITKLQALGLIEPSDRVS